MKVSEAIGKLKIGDTVWVKLKADGFDDIGAPLKVASPVDYDYMWIHENDEISLTEPQPEKVEVPDCMGTFLDRYPDKKETAMHIIMHDFTESKYFDEFVKFPLTDYPMGWDRLMASALMFGYTAEQPKRWVVKNDGLVFSGFYGGGFNVLPRFTKEEHCYYKFTDRKKAEAVATLVEGSVEEV